MNSKVTKSIWMLIAALGLSVFTNAQSEKWGEDSTKCRENLYIYYELAKNKNYAEAYEPWLYCFTNCPASSKNNFIYGSVIVKSKIKSLEDGPEKEKHIDMLFSVYDQRLIHFPGKEAYVKGVKALDMMKYRKDSIKAAYALFKEALEIGGPKQSAAFYNGYFIAAAKLFNRKVFEIGDVFEAYNVVIEGIEINNNRLNTDIAKFKTKEEEGTISDKEAKALAKAERELVRYEDVEKNIGIVLLPIATCGKLQQIYNEESFEQNKGDVLWLKRAVKMMSKERQNEEGEEEDCTGDPIFFKIAEALYNMEPSAPAARGMGILAFKNNDYTNFVKFFKEAADQEIDPKKRANDLLKQAVGLQKLERLAEAKAAAIKSASLNKNWGKPYLLLAQIYAAADGKCGSNVFEKKAVYWLAIEKLQYARSIDKEVSKAANSLISAYKKQLPDKTASFALGYKQGDKFKIACWIGESITADWNL